MLTTTSEVIAYYRNLTDDPDREFITDSQLYVMMASAYDEFRQLVTRHDQSFYALAYNFSPGGYTYALSGIMFGSTPSQPRLSRITRITRMAGSRPTSFLRAAGSREDLNSDISGGAYWLQGTTLEFSASVSGPLQMTYIPVSSVTWSSTPGFIDDLVEFHDVIALLCMQQYKIKDFAENPMHAQQLAKRLGDLKAYLAVSRSGDASRWVTESDWM